MNDRILKCCVWFQMQFPWAEKVIEVAFIHPPHPGHTHF